MTRATLGILTVVMVAGVFSLAALSAQQPQHQHEATPEIFCSTMKTGQLCSHGTTEALRLTGPKAEEWVAAVRRYNRAVNEATKQLQTDAQNLLTPQQAAELNRWFAVGMNVEMNKMLQQAVAKTTEQKH